MARLSFFSASPGSCRRGRTGWTASGIAPAEDETPNRTFMSNTQPPHAGSAEVALPSGERRIGSRFLGIDLGAETVKLVELLGASDGWCVGRRQILEHRKQPGPVLVEALRDWDWPTLNGSAVTGRFASQLNLSRLPVKQAALRGYRFCLGEQPGTVVNIGSHGFWVLELRENGLTVFRENSRCSQGTGNFLRQLIERFSLSVEQASNLCADVSNPAPLSGRCPVILKTDMTHLANKGEDRARILAGLFDAVCENVLVLVKPGASPPRVLLTGGVSRSARVRRAFGAALGREGMQLVPAADLESFYLEALGCALHASDSREKMASLESLLLPAQDLRLERLPGLADCLHKVRRMPPAPTPSLNGHPRRLVLGLDIGSTGSKLVALDAATKETVWEDYRQTLGDPVGAAQGLVRRFTHAPVARFAVAAFGVTGSGRELAGSLLSSCFGKDAVFIVNEIVAHATGALHYEPRVDTIFEIGGQDAKYIRLEEGRIIDCAMNEACSAGTGSFIEEQGRKFAEVQDVRQLGQVALAAPSGVSLGQHCSVFMAEVIDEGVAAGIEQPALISGLYDSVIKNYLNRVKGNRSVGKVIFCQGMPFSADALATAVARQTGSEVIVPPNPGTVGALGIALLATRELNLSGPALDPEEFLSAQVEQKDTFVCRASSGCGGVGNRCRIERLRTVLNGQHGLFTWGGGCAPHDKGARKRKLPDGAPDPFRQREELLRKLLSGFVGQSRPRIALADEFMLKGLVPFFAAFFHDLGFAPEVLSGADQAMLKRGIQAANVPFCAPMQLFHGLAERMAESGAAWAFVPMIRHLPRARAQRCSVVCPVVQAAPDLVGCLLADRDKAPRSGQRSSTPKLLSARVDFGPGGFASKEFLDCCEQLAGQLGIGARWREAWEKAMRVQREFDSSCLELGRGALAFCQREGLTPVVVLGRPYSIYNKVLNSNVPAILREQGAVALPLDCLPFEDRTPQFSDMYWGYGQNLLRAAHQVRRTPGLYALYCSNYSCGPDSFNLHFAAYIMEGKPFAIIETDGHSGDAGTKTRVEAFLHCVDEDRRAAAPAARLNNFLNVQFSGLRLRQVGRVNGETETMLVPHLGAASEAVAAVFRGVGLHAETLPPPDAGSLRLGRRYTSGKECLPMPLTLGSLLQRLERAAPGQRFVYVMPSTDGPCRFGVYNLLNQIVLERLGWQDRLRIWSPNDSGYFDELPAGTEILMLAGILGTDLLHQALCEVRPVELLQGESERVYRNFLRELLQGLETAGRGDLRLAPALWQVAGANLFGICDLLDRAGAQLSALRAPNRDLPRVEMTGEIYVRAVEFSNDLLIRKLEQRGLRVRVAPQSEWLAYCRYLRRRRAGRNRFADRLSSVVQHRIENLCLGAISPHLGWPTPPSIEEALAAAGSYINPALHGEAVLTLGGPLEAWRRRQIDAVVAVGPLECMPTKIAEAQFHHAAERDELLSLTLAFNGDPISTAALDNFAFEVHARFRRRATLADSR